MPIGIAMVAGSLAPIVFAGSGGSIPQLINNAFSGANSTPILAVPLFIFGGIIMAQRTSRSIPLDARGVRCRGQKGAVFFILDNR